MSDELPANDPKTLPDEADSAELEQPTVEDPKVLPEWPGSTESEPPAVEDSEVPSDRSDSGELEPPAVEDQEVLADRPDSRELEPPAAEDPVVPPDGPDSRELEQPAAEDLVVPLDGPGSKELEPPAGEQTASDLASAVDEFEALLDAPAGERSYRRLWTTLREVQEQLRSTGPITPDDRTMLQGRLRALSDRLQEEHKTSRREAAARKEHLLTAISLVSEAIEESTRPDDIHEVRTELAVIRERINREAGALDQSGRQSVWQAWQAANQAAWSALNAAWQRNEQILAALLEEAATRVTAGDGLGARERIRTFHSTAATHESSHRVLRELRQNAGRLWQEADELARRKHAAYLEHSGRRVKQWKGQQARNAEFRKEMAAEIADLESRAAASNTGVGAALLRGRVAERRKALAELELADKQLTQQIEGAEAALRRT